MVNEKQFKELNIPKTYEQFVLEEQQNQAVADSYMAELDACGGISVQKGYGPSPEQYYSTVQVIMLG